MGNEKKAGQGVQAEVQYRTVSLWRLILSVATNGSGMCFYLLIGYASYIGNVGYGIATAVVGGILTATRIFDGAIDPLIAAVFDMKKAGKHGKIRLYILMGWGIMSVADVLMFNILAERFEGIVAMIVFISLYLVHAFGYSLLTMGGGVVGIVVTNDPKQRPFLNLIGTIYSYVVPMVLSTVVSMVVLPKYDNQFNAACFRELSALFIGVSLFLALLACIGVSNVDDEEHLSSITVGGDGGEKKIRFRDMWSMLKSNKPLRMWMLAGVSDKLAQQTYSQAVVANLMAGVLIANYQVNTIMSNISMIISIGFAFVGGAYTAKHGAKKATTDWSLLAIMASVITIVFCAVLGPSGMPSVGVLGVPMIIYIVLTIFRNGSGMVLSTAAGTMRADVTDYEFETSGNMLAGTVGAIYTFIDQCVSSLGSTIAAVCISFVGYSSTVPQLGDKATWPVFWMAMFLTFGLPILGWLCNLFAMKGYELSKERMVEVQKNIGEMRRLAEEAGEASGAAKQ